MISIFNPKKQKEQEPPSILEQGLETGIFNFGKAKTPQVDYFNPSIIKRPDGTWLITRRSTWSKEFDFGMNDIMAFSLDKDGITPSRGFKVRIGDRFYREQFEDPRAVYHDGKTYIGACDFIWNKGKWTGAHQIISQVDNAWNLVMRYDPSFGMNRGNIGRNKGNEKNWTWFFHEGFPYLVYMTTPEHHVIRFNESDWTPDHTLDIICQYKTEWDSSVWESGAIQGSTPKIGGGTPPIRIGNEYFSFFHSSVLMENKKRRYHMGAYSFEAKPPFRVTRITSNPILSGSKYDRWNDNKPPCVFPCGALFDDGWFVTFGVNDLDCGWLKLSHDDLLKRMIDV